MNDSLNAWVSIRTSREWHNSFAHGRRLVDYISEGRVANLQEHDCDPTGGRMAMHGTVPMNDTVNDSAY